MTRRCNSFIKHKPCWRRSSGRWKSRSPNFLLLFFDQIYALRPTIFLSTRMQAYFFASNRLVLIILFLIIPAQENYFNFRDILVENTYVNGTRETRKRDDRSWWERDVILTESVVDHGRLENKRWKWTWIRGKLPRKNNLFLPDFRSHDDEFPRISRGYDTFCIHAAGHVATLLILREEGASSSFVLGGR